MCQECKAINEKQIANQVYDTLFGNVGLSEHHVKFDTDKVESQWMEENHIDVTYPNGITYRIEVRKIFASSPQIST